MTDQIFLGSRHAGLDEEVIVEMENGKLRGVRKNGASCFKGIPYAAATGGTNRFMAPQPVENWAGIRDALKLGNRCCQERETFGDAPILSWYGQTEPFGEDCCVLNVFTPGVDAARRPVMVYIHGGGYFTGGGGGAVLDGSNLAKFGDVVVVTLNHRLNAFGYTNLNHIGEERFGDAANAGHLDLIAALKWVSRNIAAFGGDPGSVTLFGQSGGGSKIMVLMGMPAAKGLFHRAINMSGSTGTTVAPAATTEPYVNELLKQLGIEKGHLGTLQKLPADTLINARLAAVAAKREGARPVIDGRHVVASPMSPQGLALHASVPLLIGTTRTEATFYFASDPRNLRLTENQVKARIKAQFGVDDAKADDIMAAYRVDEPQRTPSELLVALITDTLFRIPMMHAADAKADANEAPVYMYNFVWKAPVDGGIWGSPHTIDIPFAFGNTDKATSLLGTGDDHREVSRNLMAAFVAFAKSGNPNNAHMPEWKPYNGLTRATMTVDVKCQAVNDFHGGDRIAGSQLRLEAYNRAALLTYSE
ncbi:carboxylesterase/lipase family protein [Paraburkholderia domus]|uniref:Carboxylic ester hydrolase n=1 Tax=Paraburkholderia domus TaxID=2793075 RepID=A0A9N8N8W6_9BURK|nr:carboxylesterase family protein [Paraburkholderia domus]MBK5053737.1 carboxylesterase/lipase family protein [Burkholderia sp. R-70006]MBK5065613.1 carboxylesterase/lipase family protein [Burkholderia sp. R-70199]MBK5169772.1 carboxylesterase/lipase family protein [Burkholderia sp. R-70211]MBK5185253.1 carboxylesterase/lipase family protein [Burkholderia sp. R-69749]CAE6843664.1 Para-nitrobenzyl esterase [Paraburkholderia domus]